MHMLLAGYGLSLLRHKDAMYIPEAGSFAAGGTLLLKLYGSLETPATEDVPASQRLIIILLWLVTPPPPTHTPVRLHARLILLTV